MIVDNLEPVTIRGESSQGMLLAVQSDGEIRLLVPDRPVKEGARVR